MAFFGDNCVSNRSVSLNQWIHAAFVFDLTTSSMLIYQDGVLVANRTSAFPLQAAENNLTIGYIPGIASSSGDITFIKSVFLLKFISLWKYIHFYRLFRVILIN